MEKIWQASYPPNIPYEINLNEYTSIVDLFEKSCKQFAHNTAYINYGIKLSYNDLRQYSNQFALFLIQELDLKFGSRVALMMPNILQYPIALFGALSAGLVVVNINPLYTAAEVTQQLIDSEAETIIVLANFAKTVQQALPNTPIKHVIITRPGDLFPVLRRWMFNLSSRSCIHIPQQIAFRTCLQQSYRDQDLPSVNQQHLAFLQYTGGTTGESKAAMLSHGNILANILQAYAWLQQLSIDATDIVVTALPLYHIFSLTANCLLFIKIGAQNILITDPRNVNRFIKEIKHSRFNMLTGVNTLFNALLNNPQFLKVDFSHVKLILSGGMKLQQSTALRWQNMTKTKIFEAYGLTEASPAVAINPFNLTAAYNGSIGLPLPSTDISIRDDANQEVEINRPGELCVKGPQVMQGYWGKESETALAFTADEFLKTGDIVQIDSQGYLYLVDRKKDIIIVSGFNVYPNEVEAIVNLHPGVKEVIVIGIPSTLTGESVKAYIVRQDPNLTEQQIITHCKLHLTGYKIPKLIEFYSELPKTTIGKLLRRKLNFSKEFEKIHD